MSAYPDDLPPLDCHAHIAPDVTPAQVDALGGAIVFAMTRTPAEAAYASRRNDSTLVWGSGVHPGVTAALRDYHPQQFRSSLRSHCLVGEAGLDRRGDLQRQTQVLTDILTAVKDEPVLLSLHSTGRTGPLIDLLTENPHPGTILHWFLGSASERQQALDLGAYFSVNAAMPDQALAATPLARLLPETDFPASTRATKAKLPGATTALEERLAQLHDTTAPSIRRRMWQNLRELTTRTQVLDRLPEPVADLLIDA